MAPAPDVIRTDRLDLVPLEVAHADEMAVVLGDPALHAFIGGEPQAVSDLRARYERMVSGSPDPAVTWLNWVVRDRRSGELTGTVQATITDAGGQAEIAWVVGTRWQGHGIATEAARALVGWLHEHDVHTVIAHVHPEHSASAAVALAAGLRRTEQWQDGEVRWSTAPREETGSR
jgi:RimJ/RimL family protein N-acetyltransferase